MSSRSEFSVVLAAVASSRERTEDLIDLVALMPWWAGVVLAVASYVVLHSVAGQEVAKAAQPGQLGAANAQSVWRAAASLGQCAVPLICLGGAAVSAWRRHQRKELLAEASQGNNAAGALDGMSWREFEMLVGEAFRLQGYRVIRCTARRGASAGRQFWGCTGYPDCRGLRQIG